MQRLYTSPNEYKAVENLVLNDDGQDVITSEQTLGEDFWDHIKEASEDFQFRFNGLTPVASIPETIVNKWIREGFDFWDAPANEIIKKLKTESYDKFVISGNRTF